MIDVGLAIDAEAINLTLQSVAAAGGGYAGSGKWVPNTPAQTTIRGTVQPMNGRALADMPEGVRENAKHLVWSRTDVQVNDVIVGYRNKNWRISFVYERDLDQVCKFAMEALA